MLDFKEKIKQYAEKPANEILQYLFYYWGIEFSEQPFKLIVGSYEKSSMPDKNGNEYGYFQEVRSLKGDILYYPCGRGLVSLFTMHKHSITNNEYWLVNVNLRPNRNKLKNPFELSLANNVFGLPTNTFIDRVKKEKFIRQLFNARGATKSDARTISNAVLKLAGDNYTDINERFVFELLQNADDMPKENQDVSVKILLLNSHILLMHNGLPFRDIDIEAITDIGRSTKSNNPLQTGYKGIGFKIVFQESENVLIKSGGYSFSFDKNHPYYESLKKNVYSGLNNDEIPWQLKPIWTENYRYDNEIQAVSEFFNPSIDVAIAIKTKKVEQFRSDISVLLNDPRFILFLRNINSIDVSGVDIPKLITKSKNGKTISLKANEIQLSNWLTFEDIEVKITKDVKDAIKDDKSVPPKLKDVSSTKLNFVCQVVNDNITPVNPESSYLFSYLPTNVNDYKFPFLVNADFLTTANRQSIHSKNSWNLFLFEQIGYNCIRWIAEIVESKVYLKSAYNLLPNIENTLNDLPWQSFLSGFNKALELESFILSQDEKLIKINDALYDKTGFSDCVGSEVFKNLMSIGGDLISEKIKEAHLLISIISKYKEVNIISFDKLGKALESSAFREWLKVPSNNLTFSLYLSANSLQGGFSTNEIFLAEDGELYKANELYINLDSDSKSLEWLGFKKVLHHSVSAGLSDIHSPLKQYEPISFINEVICKEKKFEIIAGLNNGSISFDDFYSYLSKYASNPLFPSTEIKSFPIKTLQATLPSWTETIYFNSSSLSMLSSEKALPDGLYHLLDDNWSNTSNYNLKLLAEKLGVFSFLETEPFKFIQTIITKNKESISSFYLSQTTTNGNLTLWAFILSSFKNLSDPNKESISLILKAIPVLSKNGVFKEVHTLYLPSEFTDNDALETLSLQFPNSNIDFVSANYLEHPRIEKNEIKALFKRLDAKIDSKDFIQHKLLPNLHQISVDLFVPLTRLLYENRETEQIINSILKNNHFKLKTKEGTFKPINECYLGSPYINETLIPNQLITVPVLNQISAEYTNSQIDAWQRFFSEKLKVRELKNEAEIINLKLKHIADNIQLWQNVEASVSLLKEIYLLYRSGNLSLNTTNLTYIKKIPLLSKGESLVSFHSPNAIHFSSAYKPTFDFEKIFGLECGVPFLSEKYKFEEGTELIKFFEQFSVTQYFDQNRHSAICQNIPTADGQKKPASQLFKYEFKKYVGESNVAFEDLSKFPYNGRTLEDELKFKSKLDVASILNYINNNEPNKNGLKDIISKLLNVYIPNNDSNLINAFIKQGKLLTTAKSYNSITDLHLIDESIRSGIRENEYLIDPLFSKQENRERYLRVFNIKNLKIEDFNPHYENVIADFEFTKRVNDRLLFLAFDSDSENYLEIEKLFKEKFEQWKINKCSKISLKYPATESKIIKEDSKTFEIINEKVIYYIGSWSDPRVNPVLVDCLSKNILSLHKQRAFIQDILLNDPMAIIEDFENKGRSVPYDIKERFRIGQPIQGQNTPMPANTEIDEPVIETEFKDPFWKSLTESDVKFIRGIIGGVYELNEKLEANKTAKIKTLMKIKDKYNINEISDNEYFLKAGNDEIIVRSAQNGLLRMDLHHWYRLNEHNVMLSLYTNNEIHLFKSQADLYEFTKPKNNLSIVRMPLDYNLDDFGSLEKIPDKGKWHFVFIVDEKATAAQSYKDVMNLDDYNF
jgi:hypothetical protein